jgi:hypothetical protein
LRNVYAQVVVLGTVSNKGKNQKYQAVGTAPKYYRQIVERCKIDTSNTQIHDRSLKFQAWYMHEALKFKIIIKIKVNLLSLRTTMSHCIVPSSGLYMTAVVSTRLSTHAPSGKPAVRH